MPDYFPQSLRKLLEVEGGYVNDPDDPGGETNYGITKKLAVHYGYKGPMRDIPMAVVEGIYRLLFWDDLRLDSIAQSAATARLAYELFEAAVNVGPYRAALWCQRALVAMGHPLKVDGEIGPATIHAIRTLAPTEVYLLIKLVNTQQGGHYLDQALRNPKAQRYLEGWMKRA